ncbi:hypothetical protein ACL07V_09810 [Streptomyces sp. MB22_4]|uniref:hypothetical protein n=1 Tax=Streptomyces sp. MB22_4 TaxID=3383120 RepID=UPI0039A050B3
MREGQAGDVPAPSCSVVERAGAGDLTARGTADVATVGTALRDAGPELLIGTVRGPFDLDAVSVLGAQEHHVFPGTVRADLRIARRRSRPVGRPHGGRRRRPGP